MEQKNMNVIIAGILIILMIGLGVFFYTKQNQKKEDKKPNMEEVEDNTKDETEVENTIELDVDDQNVITLFNNAHYVAIGVDAHIFKNGGYQVANMSEKEKIELLFTQWKKELQTQMDPNTGEETLLLKEDTLKNLYETTYGNHSYQRLNTISDVSNCYQLTYDANQESFVGKTLGCGGMSNFAVHEKIISAKKDSKKLEIVSAAFYYDPSGFYKDYDKTIKLDTEETISNSFSSDEERIKLLDQYIEDNKDNLEQYTYTYVAGDNNFYYLSEVKRTKE